MAYNDDDPMGLYHPSLQFVVDAESGLDNGLGAFEPGSFFDSWPHLIAPSLLQPTAIPSDSGAILPHHPPSVPSRQLFPGPQIDTSKPVSSTSTDCTPPSLVHFPRSPSSGMASSDAPPDTVRRSPRKVAPLQTIQETPKFRGKKAQKVKAPSRVGKRQPAPPIPETQHINHDSDHDAKPKKGFDVDEFDDDDGESEDHDTDPDDETRTQGTSPGAAGKSSARNEPRAPRAREKNRIAATKCRKKQRQVASELRSEHDRLEAEHQQLASNVAELRRETCSLKEIVMQHAGCDSPLIQRYIDNAARDWVKQIEDDAAKRRGVTSRDQASDLTRMNFDHR